MPMKPFCPTCAPPSGCGTKPPGKCVLYSGVYLPVLNVLAGQNLDEILVKIDNIIGGGGSVAITTQDSDSIAFTGTGAEEDPLIAEYIGGFPADTNIYNSDGLIQDDRLVDISTANTLTIRSGTPVGSTMIFSRNVISMQNTGTTDAQRIGINQAGSPFSYLGTRTSATKFSEIQSYAGSMITLIEATNNSAVSSIRLQVDPSQISLQALNNAGGPVSRLTFGATGMVITGLDTSTIFSTNATTNNVTIPHIVSAATLATDGAGNIIAGSVAATPSLQDVTDIGATTTNGIRITDTTEPLRLLYDVTNYLSFTPVNATGSFMINAVGTNVNRTITINPATLHPSGITTGTTNTNLYIGSVTAAFAATDARYLFGGASSVGGGVGMTSSFAHLISVNNSYGNLIIGTNTITTTLTGVNNVIASLVVKGPVANSGGSTINIGATIYVEGPSTGSAVANYSLYINSGLSYFGGQIKVAGGTPGMNKVLTDVDGTGLAVWATPTAGGTGTVTSVTLSLPGSIFSVTGSPVSTTGTLTGTLVTQTANTVFAGPTSGAAAAPTFRALVALDIPSLPFTQITGVVPVAQGGTALNTVGANGTFLSSNGTVLSYRVLVAADVPVLDTSKITTGTFGTALLGSGTANSTVFLRGDGTWSNTLAGTLSTTGRITSTLTTEQIRAAFDATNFMSVTVASNGSTTLDLGGTSPLFSFGKGAAFTGGIAANNVGFNLSVVSINGGTSVTTTQYLFAGATTINYRVGIRGSGANTLAAGSSGANFIVADNNLTTAASGTTALLANAVIKAPTLVVTAGSTVTNTASLYIDAAPTGGTSNYAILIGAGDFKTPGNSITGGQKVGYTAWTAATLTATTAMYFLEYTGSISSTLTLPAAATNIGQMYFFENNGSGTVTVSPGIWNQTGGGTTITSYGPASSFFAISNGTNWVRIV